MVAGVEQAIGKMSKKESARITVKPEYAYGEEGCEDFDIPGGAKLVYEVRLNNFVKVRALELLPISVISVPNPYPTL